MATKKSPTHVDSLPGCWWITSNRKQRSVTTPPFEWSLPHGVDGKTRPLSVRLRSDWYL